LHALHQRIARWFCDRLHANTIGDLPFQKESSRSGAIVVAAEQSR
jgi:hypothetical protein